jgi:hypothetical protein
MDFEGSCRDLFEVITRGLPGGTEDNHGASVRTGGVPAEIRTKHLPNTSSELYRYANQFELMFSFALMCDLQHSIGKTHIIP